MIGVCWFSKYYAYFTCFSCLFLLLSIIPCLCCVVHIILMVKCLIDISFVTVDFMVYNVYRVDLTSLIMTFVWIYDFHYALGCTWYYLLTQHTLRYVCGLNDKTLFYFDALFLLMSCCY